MNLGGLRYSISVEPSLRARATGWAECRSIAATIDLTLSSPHQRRTPRRPSVRVPVLSRSMLSGTGEVLEGIAALDQDFLACGATDRSTDGQRCGETERARAADDQQRHRVPDRVLGVELRPDTEGDGCQSKHDGHEPTRYPVRQEHDRCAAHGAFFDQPHQAPDAGVLAGDAYFHQQPATEVDGAGMDRVADHDRLGQ